MADSKLTEYEFKTITTVRGLENRSQKKLENEGWELVSTDRKSSLRTEMSFRRLKKKLSTKTIAAIAAGVVVLAAVITLGVVFEDDKQEYEAQPIEVATEPVETLTPESFDSDRDSAATIQSDPTPEVDTDLQADTSGTSVAEAEARWLEIMQVDQPTDLINQDGYDYYAPLHLIHPGWEGSTTSYLRITVQEELDDEFVQRLGINVMNLLGPEYPDMQGVVFSDSAGIDHNFNRHEAPMADLE